MKRFRKEEIKNIQEMPYEYGEKAIQEVIQQLLSDNEEMESCLTKIRDCDWVITLPNRMDAVRDLARTTLEKVRK